MRFGPIASALLVGASLCAVAFLGASVGSAAALLAVPGAAIAGALSRRRALHERRLEALGRRDPLTGLGNARLLRERLGYELARHERHHRPLAVLMLDLDGFKGVNDRFGHAAGDEVLRDVGAAISRTVRDQDTVVRQGGDEFCVLAPETDRDAAERLVSRIHDAIAGATAGLPDLSGSLGAAIYPVDAEDGSQLLERADAAAGEAKRRSRRRRFQPQRVAA